MGDRHFKIEDKVRSGYKDIYELESTWMWNDADGYNHEKTHFKLPEDQVKLEAHVKFLDYANKWRNGCANDLENWQEACAEYLYDEVPELLHWEKEEGANREEELDGVRDTMYSLGWVSDGPSGIPYSPDGYELFYYNAKGDKYNVEVK